MERFCESLKGLAIKIIDFEKKKVKLLTNDQKESYEHAEICYICKEKFEDKHTKDKKCGRVRNHSLPSSIFLFCCRLMNIQ